MNPNIGCIILARTDSSRLPGKVLMEICGKQMLEHIIDRTLQSKMIDRLIVATTNLSEDQPIVELAQRKGVAYYQGNVNDVLGRFFEAAKFYKIDIAVRIGGDEPFIDPQLIDTMVNRHILAKADYTDNCRIKQTFPRGLDIEVISFPTLQRISELSTLPEERQHVTPFLYRHTDKFKIELVEAEGYLRKPELRLTVDTAEDLRLIKYIYENLYKEGSIISLKSVIDFLDKHPELIKINAHIKQVEVVKK